jgi:hypothetical protein
MNHDQIMKMQGPDRDVDVELELMMPQSGIVSHIRASTGRGQVVRYYTSGSHGTAVAPNYTSSVDDALRFAAGMLPEYDYLLGHTNSGLTVHAQFGPRVDDTAYGETLPLAIIAGVLKTIESDRRAAN